MRTRCFTVLAAAAALTLAAFPAAHGASQPRGGARSTGGDPRTLGGQLKPITLLNSPYYTIYTDVDADSQKEAVIRMTKMAEEYNERTRKLFHGQINQKLPFYLYAKGDDYYKAGGMQNSAGVFNGECLMAMVIPTKDGRVGPGTWHVVQHEGFHQFVKSVIRGDIPIWVNEGLAEYFGEGVFTGDDMVTGVIPASRLQRVQARFKTNGFPSIDQMMRLSHDEWNKAFSDGAKAGANYDMAWAMVHFLANAENGKYQDAFASFLVLTSKGRSWEQAWTASFGSVQGFEEKWKAYWTSLPQNPTADLYAKAAVATLTGFAGRAASQKQAFASFDELLATDPAALKHNPVDWLPPALFDDAKALATALRAAPANCTFTLSKPSGLSAGPTIECVMADGTRITGTCTLGAGKVGKVNVTMAKSEPKKPLPKSASPAHGTVAPPSRP